MEKMMTAAQWRVEYFAGVKAKRAATIAAKGARPVYNAGDDRLADAIYRIGPGEPLRKMDALVSLEWQT